MDDPFYIGTFYEEIGSGLNHLSTPEEKISKYQLHLYIWKNSFDKTFIHSLRIKLRNKNIPKLVGDKSLDEIINENLNNFNTSLLED